MNLTSLRPPSRSALEQVLLSILLGGLLTLLIVFLAWGILQASFTGQIFPGTTVTGVPVGGLNETEATTILAQNEAYPIKGRIILQYGGQTWMASPAELGLSLDAHATARRAYGVGREGNLLRQVLNQVQSLAFGISISPVMTLQQEQSLFYISKIAEQIDRPIIEASLGINGTEVVVRSGETGLQVDRMETLNRLTDLLKTMQDGVVEISVTETPPVILDVEEQAKQARAILSQPLALTLPDNPGVDEQPYVITREQLASMLSIERVAGENGAFYQVGIDPVLLRAFLQEIAPQTRRTPENARFIFNDDTRQLDLEEHAIIGRELDINASVERVRENLAAGDHEIALMFDLTNPTVLDDATAEKLGITELVGMYTSFFRGSSPDRVNNIQIASRRFLGLLVAPGETFSMAEALGDVTLDNGYAEAPIILGNQTIKGIGGGVCQVSTTLFRTAFYAGFPVVERHAHAYRVGYYEQTASGHDVKLAGMDASVFVPLVDLKFTNDTPYWLLMETYISTTNHTLTWKFYSTSDGRTVQMKSSGLKNIRPAPDPLYRENPDLAKGVIRQVDWEAEGADITVERIVTRNNVVILHDFFKTHYSPWRAVYEYGPGTKNIPTPTPKPD